MVLTGEQLRAARAIARIEQATLADRSKVSVETIKRLERTIGPISSNVGTASAIQKALEAAGVEFIPENGGGPGVRLRKDRSAAAAEAAITTLDAEHAGMDAGKSPKKALNRMKTAIAKDDQKGRSRR